MNDNNDDYNVAGLFPTSVYQQKIDIKNNDYLIEKIKEICINTPNEGNKTYKTSSHGSSNILTDNDFIFLKENINKALKNYIYDVLMWPNSVKLEIISSWANEITKKEQYHHQHVHPNSILSGVFYLKSLEEDKILFHNNDPRNTYFDIPIYKEYNHYNSTTWWLPVCENDLFIFRSDLMHSVPQNNIDNYDNNYRFSLSFNTFFKNCDFSANPTTYIKF